MSSCSGSLKAISGGKRRRSTKRSTRRRSTRRGGANVMGANGMGAPVVSVAAPAIPKNAPVTGGKRRRTAKKANKWSEFVKKVYHQGKKENKEYSFSQALKEASRLKKAGKMHM
jgi:hypothetical protein